MKSLDLSMLGIKDLFLNAPKLSDLNLSGCFDLNNDSAHLICPNLRNVDISGSSLGLSFEKEYLRNSSIGGGGGGGGGNGSGSKVNILKGGSAHDWMTNFS